MNFLKELHDNAKGQALIFQNKVTSDFNTPFHIAERNGIYSSAAAHDKNGVDLYKLSNVRSAFNLYHDKNSHTVYP